MHCQRSISWTRSCRSSQLLSRCGHGESGAADATGACLIAITAHVYALAHLSFIMFFRPSLVRPPRGVPDARKRVAGCATTDSNGTAKACAGVRAPQRRTRSEVTERSPCFPCYLPGHVAADKYLGRGAKMTCRRYPPPGRKLFKRPCSVYSLAPSLVSRPPLCAEQWPRPPPQITCVSRPSASPCFIC